MLTLDDAVSQLYGGPAETFVARRAVLVAQAKAQGDRELMVQVKALRRPTVSAAIVNHLAPEELSPLFEVGAGLRAAQTRLDAPALKHLTRQRAETIEGIMGGIDASSSVLDEVRSTLLAATADVEAQTAVASRALVRALRYAGWGDVDLADAVAHRTAIQRGTTALRLVRDNAPASASGSADSDIASDAIATRSPAEDELSSTPEARGAAAGPESLERERQMADMRRQAQEKRASAARDDLERARRRLAAADDAYRAARAARATAEAAVTRAERALERIHSDSAGI